MLYSYKGQTPAPLPFRIFLSDGSTRTDPITFTEEELKDAGFTGPYEYPECDSKIQTVDWNGTEFILRPYNQEEIDSQWELICHQRNQLLKESDWTQIEDYEFNLNNKEEWLQYRESLRNLPENQENPYDITWPQKPI